MQRNGESSTSAIEDKGAIKEHMHTNTHTQTQQKHTEYFM